MKKTIFALGLAGTAAVIGCAAYSTDEISSPSVTEQALLRPQLRFGVRGQDSYDANWCSTLGNAWNNCWGFISQLSSTDTNAYYYNLVGAKSTFETTGDSWGDAYGSLDVVDMFFGETHGGNWGANSVWAMYENGSVAYSTSMRLGDNAAQTNGGLSILSTLSCDVLAVSDGGAWTRMGSVFSGGLRVATGGWDLLYDAAGIGQNYAQRLQNGEAFGSAFASANLAMASSAHPGVMTVGQNDSACYSRLGMTIDNVLNQDRLRDGSIGYVCWTTWN
jgi:hypothetical protein